MKDGKSKNGNGTDLLARDIVTMVINTTLNELSGLTVCDIAERLGKNRCFISRKFREFHGISLSEFILAEKMRRAERLIKDRQDLDIEEISELIGFRRIDQFNNHFKNVFLLTPLQYRKSWIIRKKNF